MKAFALSAILLGSLFLAACVQNTDTPPGTPEASSASPETSSAEESSANSSSASALSSLQGAVDLAPSVKQNPGCRANLPYPLKMAGPSDAADFTRFSAAELDGSPVTEEILSGSRVNLVFVWTSYCSTHIDDMRTLQKLYEDYDREDLQIIGILASAQREDGSISDNELVYADYLLSQTGAQFPQLLPSDDLIAIHLKDLGIVPEVFVLDSDGNRLSDFLTGPKSAEELRALVDSALEQAGS